MEKEDNEKKKYSLFPNYVKQYERSDLRAKYKGRKTRNKFLKTGRGKGKERTEVI